MDKYIVKNDAELRFLVRKNDIVLNELDTRYVTDMSNLFTDMLLVGDISEWDVSNVVDMNHMFDATIIGCDINLSNWDIANVLSFNYMFNNTVFTNTVNIANWGKLNTLSNGVFKGISTYEELIIRNWGSIQPKTYDNNSGLYIGENHLFDRIKRFISYVLGA